MEISYPEHPDYDQAVNEDQEADDNTDFRLALLLSIGGSVIVVLVIYILFIYIKIREKTRMTISSTPSDCSSSTSQNVEISETSSSTSSSSMELQPITSLSTLLKLHHSKTIQEHSSLKEISHPQSAELVLHPSPLLSSISMLTTSSSLMSSRSISINISQDLEYESDHSYDHLDHHPSVNDLAPNYCH